MSTPRRCSRILLALVLLLTARGAAFVWAQTAAQTEIVNRAEAFYQDLNGLRYATVSPIVRFVVRAVPRLAVTPDETEPSAQIAAQERHLRSFRICNFGNISDNYRLTQANITHPATLAALYFDLDSSGTITAGDMPVSVGQTVSPDVAIGRCLQALADIRVNDAAVGSEIAIRITAQSGVDSAVSDAGTIINAVVNGAVITSPNDAQLPPVKLVNDTQSYIATLGERLNYTIAFRNSGQVAAVNVLLLDDLPEQLQYQASTLRIDGRLLSDAVDNDEGRVNGQRVEIRLGRVEPNQVVRVAFQAAPVGLMPAGAAIENTAALTAANARRVVTSSALVIVSPFGAIYSGRGGASAPVANARVTLFNDREGTQAVSLPPDTGYEPNAPNANPFTTGRQGYYSFVPERASSFAPRDYYLNVSAEGFRARLVQVTVESLSDGLFNLSLRALDSQPLALPGGFTLTETPVTHLRVAVLAFNIPMFARSTLEIAKSADRSQAEIGDLVSYRVEAHNAADVSLYNLQVTDDLPPSFNYVSGTARLLKGRAETPIEPVVNGSTMIFNVPEAAAGERFSLTYRARIGVNAPNGDQYNSAVARGSFASGESVATEPVKVAVRVYGGLFSSRQIIVGRVFQDANGNNRFDKGEKGAPNVRVYLANGAAAITDEQGQYSFPAVADGTQVISLDPLTLPANYSAAPGRAKSDKLWTRMLRAPLGGGALLRQNFALRREAAGPQHAPEPTKLAAADLTLSKTNPPTPSAEVAPALPAVSAGEARLENLLPQSVVNSPALNIEVSVALNWKVQVELNKQNVGDNNIGATREDHRTSVTTFTFVGLGLKPGPNTLRVTAIEPDGKAAKSSETIVYGRGNARRIEITTEKAALQASGRDRTKVFIRAFDEWNNPAQDAALAVQTTSGSLINLHPTAETKPEESKAIAGSEVANQPVRQQTVNLQNGVAELELVSGNQIGEGELKAILGAAEATTQFRLTPEMRPTILVGLAEFSLGRNAPENALRGTDERTRGHARFFFRGGLFGTENLLTLAYDSQQPLNRLAGQDRLFQLSPFERSYQIVGDSSTRFQEAESNSKVYARLDRGRSYALFGDFEADMSSSRLTGYGRKLTGVKIHAENSGGDFLTVSGARPDTSFARQVIPGGELGFVRLKHFDILPGSELLVLEARDRRNPEIILTRENLTRGADYNLDLASGTVIFLRPLATFDSRLNLLQVVATYEYRANGIATAAYTARGVKNLNRFGLKLGFSLVNQKQNDARPFRILGADFIVKLPRKGKLEGEYAMSRGSIIGGFAQTNGQGSDGSAYFAALTQPLPQFGETILRGELNGASANYFNPFGATVTPGSRRAALSVETKPFKRGRVKLNLVHEANRTPNVNNNRFTAGLNLAQNLGEKVTLNLGYDFRRYQDRLGATVTKAQLFTLGGEYKPTEKLDFSVKREQNLGAADPSFPNQTTFAANYQVNNWSKLFFTQRLASAAIAPIADLSLTGLSASRARRETAFGIESKLGKYSNLTGRYQQENGINAGDSFAVVGFNNRLPLSKKLGLEFGAERAFHLKGAAKSFNNFSIGGAYSPNEDLRANLRYEFRNRDGVGQILSTSVAGNLRGGWTALARFQTGHIAAQERRNKLTDGQLALAVRPHETDKYGLLFNYSYRNTALSSRAGENPTRLRADTLSADGFYELSPSVEVFARAAVKVSGDGNPVLPFARAMTYLLQARARYLLGNSWDAALEARNIYQPAGKSSKRDYAAELGYWATPDVRLAVGYNFRRSLDFGSLNNTKGGFYFTISTKISRLFDLFGTATTKLEGPAEKNPVNKSDQQ